MNDLRELWYEDPPNWDERFSEAVLKFYTNNEGFCPRPNRHSPSESMIYALVGAVRRLDDEEMHKILGCLHEHEILRLFLWCGAHMDVLLLSFAKGFIQTRPSILELLTHPEFRNMRGESLLHIAIRNDRYPAVKFLLNEWSTSPVRFFRPVVTACLHLLIQLSNVICRPQHELCWRNREAPKSISSHFDAVYSSMKAWGRPLDLECASLYAHYFRFRMSEWWNLDPNAPLSELVEKLEGDEHFFNASLRAQDFGYLETLWELYGHNPLLFHSMADWAASIDADYFFNEDLLNSRALENPEFRNFITIWSQINKQKCDSISSFLEILCKDWNEMLEWPFTRKKRQELPQIFLAVPEPLSPLAAGLHVLLDYSISKKLNEAVDAAKEPILSLLREGPVERNPVAAHCPNEVSKEKLHPDQPSGEVHHRITICCRYLLASAGSGKTHLLMERLSKHYGFYFISGAIEENPVIADGEALFQPQSLWSSHDTKLLFDTTRSPWISLRKEYCIDLHFIFRCSKLLYCRCLLFQELKVRLPYHFSPSIWLRYQLSRNRKEDFFRKIFWLLLLSPNDFRSNIICDGLLGDFLWCFDEVQSDLIELIIPPSHIKGPWFSFTLLQMLLHAVANLGSRDENAERTVYLSGTALNID